MTAMFDLSTLTEPQLGWVREAIAECDFPFELMTAGLAREGKTQFRVEQADLSRWAASDGKGHEHVHDGDAVAHPIERVVEGRRAVLGLYYLPPHSKIVLERTMDKELTKEVFGAEVAHAVDYCYMTPEMRRAFANAVHTEQLSPLHPVADDVVFNLDGHQCSWFDGTTSAGQAIPYRWWVGEAFMEGFVEAFMPTVKVTIQLAHPVGPEDVAVIRKALLPAPPAPEGGEVTEPTETQELHAALKRFLGTATGRRSPRYLRDAADAWLTR